MKNHWPLLMNRDFVFPGSTPPIRVMEIADQGEYDFHSHEGYLELVIVKSGRALHIVDKMRYPIAGGDVFLIPEYREHAYCNPDGLVLQNVIFDPQELKLPWYDLVASPGYQVLFKIDPNSDLPDRFENRFRLDFHRLEQALELTAQLKNHLESNRPGKLFFAINTLSELLGFLVKAYEDYGAAELPGQTPHRLGLLTGFLEKHYAENITIEAMCRRAGMSRADLFRKFQLFFKTTPLAYLREIRLRNAKELLLQSKWNIATVAVRCGFCDGNYFTRQFRDSTGITPKRFRSEFVAK